MQPQQQYKCDICLIPLTREQMTVLTPMRIGEATAKGFIPSRINTRGTITKQEMWGVIVGRYTQEEWGICPECLEEMNRY